MVDSGRDRSELLVRWALPFAVFACFAATAPGYGVFRDELYYIACARHLDWGYVDHPPVVALIALLARIVFRDSWIALRMLSAVAAAGSVVLVGDMSRDLGGGRASWRGCWRPRRRSTCRSFRSTR